MPAEFQNIQINFKPKIFNIIFIYQKVPGKYAILKGLSLFVINYKFFFRFSDLLHFFKPVVFSIAVTQRQ